MESKSPTGALLPQFYAGRSIFITGGTGFMGKTWKDFKRRAIQKALSGKVDSIEMAKCIEIIKARKRADSDDADDLEQTNVEDNSNQFEDSKNNDDDNIMCERFQKPPKVEKKFRTKRIRSSQAQLNYLREYMKSHQDFASNRDKSFMGQKRYEAEWVKLKGWLDQHGLEKSLHKWKTTWRDIKRQKYKERAKSDDNNTKNDSVLIERLLSTCPDIGLLHLLMRPKRDVEPEKRLQQLKESQVFGVLRENNPSQLDKLRMVPGDVSADGLGLSAESIESLKDVSIVFHSAATLKFDEALNIAVNQNVRSVIRLMDICDTLPKMAAFIHVSTAYSNAEKSVVEEEVYPPPAPLDQLLAITEAVPEEYLAHITHKYISPKPNTYTFTKAMAENAVKQRSHTRYPVAIFRPTIVISSVRNPYPGWVENLNGPTGVLVGSGKGLLHVFMARQAARADMLPVDIAIDTLIAAAWETAANTTGEVKVYNCSTYENPIKWRDFEVSLRKNLREHPLDNAYWYPSAWLTDNRYAQRILEILLQTIPLHIAQYIITFFGIKTKLSLITVSQRLHAMNEVLMFFTLREWHFKTDNVKRLREKLSPADAKIYNLDPQSINWKEHNQNFVKGTRKYLLREKDEDLDEAKRHVRRMCFLHYAVMALSFALLFRVLLQNNMIKEIVYGVFNLLLSLFNFVYTSVTVKSG